MKTGFTWWN